MKITFAPGPSKVYDGLPQYMQDAYQQGILSANHRSAVFMDLYQEVEQLMREKLHVPADFKLLFTSSATENWEIISQSIVQEASFHVYSGSFGKKWFDYAKHIVPATQGLKLDANEVIDVASLNVGHAFDVICLTQNETSNATQVRNEYLAAVAAKYPEKLIAVDTTSSMGGIALDWQYGDIWYASVQKCFGLPAGLGILLLSPRAIAKVKEKGESGRYNSLSFMLENAVNYQTHYTPNVFGIYLLKRVLQDMPEIQLVDQKIKERMRALEDCIANTTQMRMLITNEQARSSTVMGVTAKEDFIASIKKAAEKVGMQLGGGYGPLKATSFRIANFPAITDEEFNRLLDFLKNY
jgi:phosphoserine aminotransferase